MTKEQQTSTLGVCFRKVSVSESKKIMEEQQIPTLGVHIGTCLSYRESKKMMEEQQGPTLGVRCW